MRDLSDSLEQLGKAEEARADRSSLDQYGIDRTPRRRRCETD